jgi:SAM-dependent methyltransferase
MTDPYAGFACVYDDWQKQFHPPYWKYVLGRTRPLLRDIGSVLDLACGTGGWSIPAARTGACVYAVDGSTAMLSELRRKRGRLPVRIIEAPLWRFRLPEPVELAGCFFDSLNHLVKPAQFEAALACVARSLRTGKWFIFDLNNEHSFRDLWRGQFITHTPLFTVNISSRYDRESRIARAEVVIFRAKDYRRHASERRNGAGGVFIKTRTIVHERYYTDEEVYAALDHAGFDQISKEEISPFPGISAQPLKSWWRCRKKESS